MNDEKLLKVAEVAALLGCHEQSIYRLARLGEIKSLKLGRRRRFTSADLAAWIDAKRGANDDSE